MEPAGWIIMCVSIVLVLCLVSWCYHKVLNLPPVRPNEKP